MSTEAKSGAQSTGGPYRAGVGGMEPVDLEQKLLSVAVNEDREAMRRLTEFVVGYMTVGEMKQWVGKSSVDYVIWKLRRLDRKIRQLR